MKTRKMLTPIAGLILLIFGLAGNAGALTITDLYGDKDSFGTGKSLGQYVSVNEVLATSPSPSDGDFDRWNLDSFSWTHSIAIPSGATIISATLEVHSLDMEDDGAGDGFGGGPFDDKLFLDGVELPGAFDTVYTPDGTAATYLPPNMTVLIIPDSFFGSILDGSLDVLLDPAGGSLKDAIALDYAELTVEYEAAAPVPEPSTALLLGAGLIAVVCLGKRFRFKASS